MTFNASIFDTRIADSTGHVAGSACLPDAEQVAGSPCLLDAEQRRISRILSARDELLELRPVVLSQLSPQDAKARVYDLDMALARLEESSKEYGAVEQSASAIEAARTLMADISSALQAQSSAAKTGAEDRRLEVQQALHSMLNISRPAVPPEARRLEEVEQALHIEQALHSMLNISKPVASPAPPPADVAQTTTGPALGSRALPSEGSRNHRCGTCKPCAHFHSKGCLNGVGGRGFP